MAGIEAMEAKPGHSDPPSVAPATPAGEAPNAAPANSALASVPRFGGLRGGRARNDGLKPGTPEAQAADRERDKQRKQRLRDAAMPEPAPQVAAKWMNKAGISAENQPEIVLGTAVVSILAVHMKLIRKLDKLIATREAAAIQENKNHKPINQ